MNSLWFRHYTYNLFTTYNILPLYIMKQKHRKKLTSQTSQWPLHKFHINKKYKNFISHSLQRLNNKTTYNILTTKTTQKECTTHSKLILYNKTDNTFNTKTFL